MWEALNLGYWMESEGQLVGQSFVVDKNLSLMVGL